MGVVMVMFGLYAMWKEPNGSGCKGGRA